MNIVVLFWIRTFFFLFFFIWINCTIININTFAKYVCTGAGYYPFVQNPETPTSNVYVTNKGFICFLFFFHQVHTAFKKDTL